MSEELVNIIGVVILIGSVFYILWLLWPRRKESRPRDERQIIPSVASTRRYAREEIERWHREQVAKQAGTCRACEGEHWVCETHPDRPWSGLSPSPSACPEGCAGPGMPCLVCSPRKP